MSRETRIHEVLPRVPPVAAGASDGPALTSTKDKVIRGSGIAEMIRLKWRLCSFRCRMELRRHAFHTAEQMCRHLERTPLLPEPHAREEFWDSRDACCMQFDRQSYG